MLSVIGPRFSAGASANHGGVALDVRLPRAESRACMRGTLRLWQT